MKARKRCDVQGVQACKLRVPTLAEEIAAKDAPPP